MGDSIDVMITEKKGTQISVSRKRAVRSPWPLFDRDVNEGQELQGHITGLREGLGAFVEVREGIVGLIHHSRLPMSLKKLTIGNAVRVGVERKNIAQKKLNLTWRGTIK